MSQASYIPSPQAIRHSRLADFAEFAYAQYQGPVLVHRAHNDWRALWQWSVEDRGNFWQAVMDYSGVIADRGQLPALIDADHMMDAKWFSDTRLNYAENCLRATHQGPALIAVTETGSRREMSYSELREQVRRFAGALIDAGVGENDVVGAILPNGIEAIIALLATASIGATFTSCSPDFGLAGLLDRFGQSRPKVLWVADGYFYNGKTIDLVATISALAPQLSSVEQIWVCPFLDPTKPAHVPLQQARSINDIQSDRPLQFRRVAFNHPLYILYSSGTTGVPKCIIHGTGGVLLQHLKEHRLHCDLRPGERFFYFTTLGWMMWNWLVSGLSSGATLVLYDGSPFHPGPEALWNLVANERINVFGTSPKYLSALEKSGYRPRQWHDLGALRLILSTGSPIAAEQYTYVAEHIAHVPLASISGGTDIVSCFALGNPWRSIYPGEIPSLGLGMAVDVCDDQGVGVIGSQGELVCRKAFPSMPLGFLNDPDRSRYRHAYFSRFENVWHHGDYAILTKHQTLQILGRSDAVLNPGGVRIGTAEIYRQVERLAEVMESIAVGQQWHDDVRVVLFVRLKPNLQLDDALVDKIKATIRDNTTARHVPAVILAVTDIPRTRSGKIVEIAVRDVIHNRVVKNTEALANPEALSQFKDRPELQ